MRSTAARALLGAALLIAAVILFAVLQGGSDDDDAATNAGGGGGTAMGKEKPPTRGDSTTEPAVPDVPIVIVRRGGSDGGVRELSFVAGDRIRFIVKSEVSDEVHVHGYDVTKVVDAGGFVAFDFEATIEGVFEVEMENRGEQIAELRVNP